MKKALALTLALASGTLAPSAQAGGRRIDWMPEPARSDGWVEGTLWPNLSTITGAILVGGQGAVSDHVMIDVRLPIAFVASTVGNATKSSATLHSDSSSSSGAGGIGNPTIAVRYVSTPRAFTWSLGGGVSAPLASIDSAKLQAADVAAMAATGGHDAYHWMPAAFPVFLHASAELRPVRPLALRLTLEPTAFAPLAHGVFRAAIFEKLVVEARHPGGFCGGVGLLGATYLVPGTSQALTLDSALGAATGGGGVAVLTTPAVDQLTQTPAFTALAFIGYDDGTSFFVRAGGVLGLAGANGLGTTAPLLAPTLQLGAYFGGDDAGW